MTNHRVYQELVYRNDVSIENNAYRLHLPVFPQLPGGFRATFLDALSPLSLEPGTGYVLSETAVSGEMTSLPIYLGHIGQTPMHADQIRLSRNQLKLSP